MLATISPRKHKLLFKGTSVISAPAPPPSPLGGTSEPRSYDIKGQKRETFKITSSRLSSLPTHHFCLYCTPLSRYIPQPTNPKLWVYLGTCKQEAARWMQNTFRVNGTMSRENGILMGECPVCKLGWFGIVVAGRQKTISVGRENYYFYLLLASI